MAISEKTKPKPRFREGAAAVFRHVRPHKRLLVGIICLGFISAIANGLVPYVTGRFFDALIHLAQGSGSVHFGFSLWVILLAVWTLVQIFANGADWITDRFRRTLDTRITMEIQSKGLVHLLRLPLAFHANEHINGQIEKVNNASWRVTHVIRTVVQITPQFLSVLIGIGLAMSINLTLAGILAIGLVVYICMLVPLLIPLAAADDMARKKWNAAWNAATEAVNQVTSVKQATAEAHEERKTLDTFLGTVFGLWMRLERTWSNMSAYQRIVVFLTQLAVFVVSVGFVANGTITVGELVALNGYAMMFFGPFVQLGYGWQTIQNGLTAAVHLDTILAVEEEPYHREQARIAEDRNGEVVFESASLVYEEDKGDVLQGLNFKIKAGDVVALVGESGAGKSSTLALISGYYFPNEGSVRVDGIDTREWDLTELRKRIAVVPQEVALFNDTLRANIRYGTFDATDAEIDEAAKQAHIDEFIHGLPEGYDTLVGERGIKLSVGQKQRVAIARAILRNPEILILDEPTSALDPATEQLITKSLEKLMRGRTTFIIAHRLSTVRRADKILVMEKGKIVEEGSHIELTAMEGGVYRRLYELHIGLRE